ncbi:dehydrogenase [Pseudomonas sp. C27(2019)]|uniref:PA2817 family protein n=1 Tax=Pseudomonas sp. C27(2019) TaxID=2604941 RepID=UPI00124482D0|nr:PA2817 family protein [Pseudomonas sp. C27(2019)]QEY59234.1 dehydrogenase [Pseudomonas sp. C27(2019)]
MTTAHVEQHLQLLAHLRTILVAVADAEVVPENHHALFLERYDDMVERLRESSDDLYMGQDIISQVFQRYPQIAHMVPRDLLWFFGGDCLHFMPDDEIDKYQQLEERRFQALEAGEDFDWNHEIQLMFMPKTAPEH